MADRDYRITYKTREADSRTRIPTALDPYLYPDDRDELKRNVALARVRASRYDPNDDRDLESVRRETIRDGVDSTARGATRPTATKTTYSVTSAGLEKESEVLTRVPTQGRETTVVAPSSSISRRGDYRDDRRYERTATVPAATSVRAPSRPYDDREFSRVEGAYEVERPRMENGVYVVDARDADVFVSNGGRESGRGFAGYRNDPYEDGYRSSQARPTSGRPGDYRQGEAMYSSRDDYRSSAPSINSGAPYMSGARTERAPTAARSQTRASTKFYEDDRAATTVVQGPSRQSTRREEDDFAFVERRDTRAPSVRESFKDPFQNDGPPETPRGRTRASTFTKSPSDEEYVMVSPPQNRSGNVGRASSTGENLRSSLVRPDSYSNEERQQRRRSRSISFRAHEADDHYAGDRYHQPPGEEAAACGKYLKSYGGERSRADFDYISRSESRRDDRELAYRPKSNKYEERDYDRRERDSARYGAQRSRSKSQRRRGSDDESYISTRLEKTKKTTYY